MNVTTTLSPNGEIAINNETAPLELLVGTVDGVAAFKREAAGSAWVLAGRSLEGNHVSAMMARQRGGSVFASIHDGGIYFSGDRGAHWEERTDGVKHRHVYTVAGVERNGREVIYAGTEPVALYESDTNGVSWQELPSIGRVRGHGEWSFPPPPHLAHVKCIAFHPANADVIYVAVEQGALLRSRDRGATWVELEGYAPECRAADRDIHRVVVSPRYPDEVYMTSGMGVFFSANCGDSWEKLTGTEFAIGYPDHFAISPFNERTLFMVGARTDPRGWRKANDAGGTIYRSDDKGRTWGVFNNGLTVGPAQLSAFALSAYPGGYSMFAGTTDGKVFTCENGETWALVTDRVAPISKGIHHKILEKKVG